MLATTLSSSSVRASAFVALLAGITACAPASSTSPASLQAMQSPILLTCPAGQQPLLRQVVVNGAAVPQVECVTAPAAVAVPVGGQLAPPPATYATSQAAAYAPLPAYTPAQAPREYVPAAPAATARTVSTRPAARAAVYDDDVVEYRQKKGRSVKKSALIIGSSAGIGAGIGAATGGKKGALIGAAIGGGAATVWDQATRR